MGVLNPEIILDGRLGTELGIAHVGVIKVIEGRQTKTLFGKSLESQMGRCLPMEEEGRTAATIRGEGNLPMALSSVIRPSLQQTDLGSKRLILSHCRQGG